MWVGCILKNCLFSPYPGRDALPGDRDRGNGCWRFVLPSSSWQERCDRVSLRRALRRSGLPASWRAGGGSDPGVHIIVLLLKVAFEIWSHDVPPRPT